MYTGAKLISDVILIKELMMKEGSSLLCFKNPFLDYVFSFVKTCQRLTLLSVLELEVEGRLSKCFLRGALPTISN